MHADGVLVQIDTRFFYTETDAIEEWMNSGEDRFDSRYWIHSATEGRLIEMIPASPDGAEPVRYRRRIRGWVAGTITQTLI
jgi:hypothetical protein